ncbi:MAG: CopD family protein [Candidatus Rokubacteria bacterium]|nr:CopD family protein [Candidatus Rokubacteria bacterium]
MAGFVDVLLRGAALCGQAVAVGGVVWILLLLRPAVRARPALAPVLDRSLVVLALGAAVAAAAQLVSLAVQLGQLRGDGGWPLREILATTFFRAALARIVACLGLIGVAVAARRGAARAWPALVGCALVLVVSVAWLSHAAARPGPRALLLVLDTVHQLAAGVWIGGLVHLLAGAARRGGPAWPALLLKRFSMLALGAVAVLVMVGVGLSMAYIDGLPAVLGTAYGLMVVTKATIFTLVLALGALNFVAVRRLAATAEVGPVRLRRFVEVEIGLGLTALFVAASLSSLPPAVDVVGDRATFAEVATRFTPRWPTLTSPKHEELPVNDPDVPRTDADRAWSEFNHHVAGLFVLAMGLLAMLYATGRVPWAHHWPLLFLGLAALLVVRNDPGDWPLGPRGFWEGMTYPSVFQHRMFMLLIVAFAIFEWMVRSGRLVSARAALVFPLLCAVGSALLLTHSHASLNLKDEYLIELTHAPLGLLGMTVGWGRWLELRLPHPDARLPGWLWAVAFVFVGVLLLLYRES